MHEACQIRVPQPPPAGLTSSKHTLDECLHCWPWICDLCLYLTPNPPLGEVTSSHLQFTLHPGSAFGRTTVKEKALELYLDTLTCSSPGVSCTCSCCPSLSILCIIPVYTLFSPSFRLWRYDKKTTVYNPSKIHVHHCPHPSSSCGRWTTVWNVLWLPPQRQRRREHEREIT